MHILGAFSTLVLFSSTSWAFARSPDDISDDCKCVPNEPCWPSDAEFQALNQSVAGYLIQGVPPGSVCYTDQPNYNETQCEYVRDNWLMSTFHALNPISVGWPQWAGNPCPPIFPNGTSVNGDAEAGAKGCTLGGYPDYALNATDPAHVQKVVQFTKDHKIRLNVKSTGHSFTGRSTAFGSISIWTHYLQGIQYAENFQADSCSTNSTPIAFRIAAGSRVRDVYEAANEHDAIVVGGSGQDVGIVGWMTGGGHGPLSQEYGMGVDNVLQATIVTPNGDLVIANECQHPDLFWAIRGGGGGTFGVVTEVVMKGYPAPTTQTMSFGLLATDDTNLTTFWNSVTYFWSELPQLKAAGVSGYSYILPPQSSQWGVWAMVGRYALFDHPNGTLTSLFEQFKQPFSSNALNWNATPEYFPSFYQSWNSNVGYEPVGGGGGLIGSRLLPPHSLTTDLEHLKFTLQNVTSEGFPLEFFMVPNNKNRNLNVSLNPAWRDATLHVIATGHFADSSTLEEQDAAYNKMTYTTVPQLKSLAPDSGAYFNEGDPNDPAWQWTFFGPNYARLRAVKEMYDPDSVLWCRSCVGSEDWIPHDRFGDDRDGEGRLCRATWATGGESGQSVIAL